MMMCSLEYSPKYLMDNLKLFSSHIIKSQFSSDSVSPAFLIRVGAAMEYSGSGEEEDEGEAKENIYEEIRDKCEEEPATGNSRKSSSSSHEVSVGSSGSSGSVAKSRFQKALEAVTRRSSRSLEHGERSGRAFHLSISKGRKKSLIDRAQIDWDCDPEVGYRCRGPGLMCLPLSGLRDAEPAEQVEQRHAGGGRRLALQGPQPAPAGRGGRLRFDIPCLGPVSKHNFRS
jgi:hypothetical protein